MDETKTKVKISDFGLSKNFLKERLSQCVGSVLYVAPEVLICDSYDQKVDIWSVGVMAYMLLCGFAPFDADDDNELEIFNKITKGNYSMDSIEWKDITEEPKNFVRQTLTFNPEQRPNAHDLLNHAWFSLNPNTSNSLRSSSSKKVAKRLSELITRSKTNPQLKLQVITATKHLPIPKTSSLPTINDTDE